MALPVYAAGGSDLARSGRMDFWMGLFMPGSAAAQELWKQ